MRYNVISAISTSRHKKMRSACSSLENADLRECMAGNQGLLSESEQREACQCALERTKNIVIERATPEQMDEVLTAGIECTKLTLDKRTQ